MQKKQWTEEEIADLIRERTDAVCKALTRLLSFQTHDEQNAERTAHSNGVGFNAYDAPLLTSFAKQVEAGRFLSGKQLAIARKRLLKYTKQLTVYANNA